MANFVKLAATAKRLIDKNGRDIVLIKFGSSPVDDSKPWRGRNEYPEAEVTGKAVFIPRTLNLTTKTVNEDGVPRSCEYFLFAANNDAGQELETFNVIVDENDVRWRIESVEVLGPADTRIIYQIEVCR